MMANTQRDALVAQLTALLGITDTDFLKADVVTIADVINTYCNRTIYKDSFVDKFRSVERMRPEIFTRQFPIVSITHVKEDGVTLVADVDYEIADAASGMLRRLSGGAPSNWVGNVVIEISYSAGFDPYPSDLIPVLSAVIEHDYAKKAQRELSKSAGGLDGIQRLTIFDVGSVELSQAGPWQSDASDVHPILGNYTYVLDSYRTPIGTGTRAPYEAARLS